MIHPELRLIGNLIKPFLRYHSRAAFERSARMQTRWMTGKFPKGMQVEQKLIPRQDGGFLRLLICHPTLKTGRAAGVLWLHGGGYAIGLPEQDLPYAQKMMDAADALIVLPDYRTSLQAPYPAALNDAYDALLWLKDNAPALGANPHQLFVGGESAGGGLAAALSAYARDRGEVQVAFQMPFYPMLDDRMLTPSSRDNHAPVWDSRSNAAAWQLYLGELYGTDAVPAYAAPARLTDFSGLPPTYTFVGDAEPFYDETVQYVAALQSAGGTARLDVYPGCFHAFDLVGARTQIGKTATQTWIGQFQHACAHYFAAQK